MAQKARVMEARRTNEAEKDAEFVPDERRGSVVVVAGHDVGSNARAAWRCLM